MQEDASIVADAITALRGDLPVHATDPQTQQRYETWARRDHWRLREEAVPLVVGCDPAAWQAHLGSTARTALADELHLALARDLDVDPAASVSPLAVRRWAHSRGQRLPQALSSLLDFVASVLPQAGGSDAAGSAETEVLRAQERETLLGAALMLVTKEQSSCLDEDGRYSPEVIARLILARARLWFPLAPPTLDEAGIAALVAHWTGRPTPFPP